MGSILDKLNLLGPASQVNPLRGNVFSDAIDNAVSSETAAIPGPQAPMVGSDYAARLMAQRGDLMNALSTTGVKPQQQGLAGIRRTAPGPQMKFAPSPVPQGVSLPTTPARRSLV